MSNLRLVSPIDFGVVYDALKARVSSTSMEEWEKISKGVLTREIFVSYCLEHQYPSQGIECDGQQIGGIFFDGSVVHIEILPEYHGRWSLLLPDMIRWTFAQKDPIQVAVARHDVKINRFMVRNNWPLISESEEFNTYEMSSKVTPLFTRRLRTASPSPATEAAA